MSDAQSESNRALERFLTRDRGRVAETVKALLDSGNAGLVLTDHENTVVTLNRAVVARFELDEERHLGRSIDVLLKSLVQRARDAEAAETILARLRDNPVENAQEQSINRDFLFQNLLHLEDPKPRTISVYCGIVYDERCRPFGKIWAFDDVTELQREEERMRALVEVSPIPLTISSLSDGTLLFANEELADMVGLPKDEILGRPSTDFYANPEDRAGIVAALREQGSVSREMRLRRPNGSEVWAVMSLKTTVLGGETVVLGGLHDVTERREAEDRLRQALQDLEHANDEVRETHAHLVRSEKMASLGMLVAGVAHEINTPIGAVRSMHDSLMRALGKLRGVLDSDLEAERKAKKVDKLLSILDDCNRVIADGTSRVTQIVRRLRSFARLDEAELKEVDVVSGIEDTLGLIHHELKNNIEVERDFQARPIIACYPGALNQVLLNLLMNARQAISDRGRIKVTTRTDDEYFIIEVEDDGGGIPKENVERIFDPGFTTKGVGVGTGLGLSICYQIVQDHRGRILVDSEEGRGTRFTVCIPLNLGEQLEMS